MLALGALAATTGCTSTTGGGVGGAGGASPGGADGGIVAQCATISGIQVVTSLPESPMPMPPASSYVSAMANCPAGKVAIGGGGQFVDTAGGIKDGALMSSLPLGGSSTMPPTGWVVSGSTQYTGANGMGPSDQLIAYVVCAAGIHPSTVTTAAPLVLTAPPQSYFLNAQASCLSGQTALSGGVRFADAIPSTKDGLLMSSLPDYTGSNPPPAGSRRARRNTPPSGAKPWAITSKCRRCAPMSVRPPRSR